MNTRRRDHKNRVLRPRESQQQDEDIDIHITRMKSKRLRI